MTAGPLMGSVNKQREIGDATTTGLSSVIEVLKQTTGFFLNFMYRNSLCHGFKLRVLK